MVEAVRVLNEDGARLFREFVERARKGSAESPPWHLLTDEATSAPLDFAAEVELRPFASRVALRYFDQLCPPTGAGARKLLATGHYVLEGRFAHNRYYRHLVRAAWYAMALHGTQGEILLTSAGKPTPGIGQWGEISEQLAGYQDILGSRTAMVVAAKLFLDDSGATKRGAASPDGPGSVRRLSTVLRQLAMTHDLRTADPAEVVAMLPDEFEAFRGGPKPSRRRSLLRRLIGGGDARQ
jgi:hypothetical protein